MQGLGDIGPLSMPASSIARLDGGQAVAARLAAQLSVTRRMRGPRMTALAFQHPALRHHSALAWLQVPSSSTMPSMSFQDGALVLLNPALAVDGDDIAVGIELWRPLPSEISTAQRLGSATCRPSALERLATTSDLQHRVPEMQRGSARRANACPAPADAAGSAGNLVFDRRDAVAKCTAAGVEGSRGQSGIGLRYGGAGIRLDVLT